MLALKLVLVPMFLLLVSMSDKWWGPKAAGWLAGFPVVAGAVRVLYDDGMWPIVGLVFATTFLMPLLQITAMAYQSGLCTTG